MSTLTYTVNGAPVRDVEGDTFLRVKMTPELMEQWATRDNEGYRLIWDWGEPDAEGFYCPAVTRDMTDRLVGRWERVDR